MEYNYLYRTNKLIASFKSLLLVALFIGCNSFIKLYAQVTVTVPTLTTITGCSFPTPYSFLGDIVITENANGNISTFGTITLSAPSNFEFESGTGSVSITAGTDITSISATSITTSSVSFTINGSTFSSIDEIKITGLKVRGITAAAGPQNVTRTAGTSVISGDANGEIHASFTSYLNSITSGTIASAQTICEGGDPAAFTLAVVSTGSGSLSYQWFESTDGYASAISSSSIYNVPSGLTASTTYRRIATSTLNSLACDATSNDIIVTVNFVTGGTIAAAQTICSGGDPAAFTVTDPSTGSGSPTYQWKYSTDSYSSILATSSTYDVPSGLTVATTYRRITISTLGALACSANSNDLIVTVNTLTGGTVAASQTICSGGDPAAFTQTVASTGLCTLTYEWKSSSDSFTAFLGTGTTYDPPSGLTSTTTYRRITTCNLNGSACSANSNDLVVTVNSITGGTIAASQTICSGGDPAAFTESVAPTGSGTLTYEWKHSADAYSAVLSTSATYDVAAGLTTTTTYRRTSIYTLAGVACSALSNDITVTVNAVTGGTIASAQTICSGGDPAAFTESVASSGSGSLTYEWRHSANSYGSSLSSSSTYDVAAGLTATTTYRRVTISTQGAQVCSANSNDIVVTINSVTGGTIATSQTICYGGDPAAFSASVAPTGSGTLTYQWKASADGYAAVLGTSATYDVPSGLIATTSYRLITISTLAGIACTANSNDITVTINSLTGGTIAAAQTICNGGNPDAFSISVASSGSGTLTYNWFESADGYVSSLASSSTYDAPGGLTATNTYRRITTSTLGGSTCTANSNDIIVTVQSAVTGGTIAAAQTICSGGDPAAFTQTVASSGSGTLTYQWKYSTDAFSTLLGTNNTYDVPSGLSVTTSYRRITISTVGSITCTANSNDLVISVNDIAAGTIASAQTICNGGNPNAFTTSVAATGSGTLSYAWKNSSDSYAANIALTETYDVPNGLTTTTTYRRIATSTQGGITCSATSNDIVVSVQGVVSGGTIAGSQTICNGGDPAAFSESAASTGSGTLTYEWKQSTDSYAATLGTSETYNVPSGLTATTTYRRITTSTLNGVPCSANSNDLVVTVSVVTGGTIAAAQTICSGGNPAAFTESVASSGPGTLTYDWKYDTDSYSSTLGTSSTYDAPSGLTATTTYRRITTSTSGGVSCTANSNDIIVTVNSVTAGTIASSQTICSAGDPAAFTVSTPATGGGTLSYEWKQSTDSYTATLATTATYDVSAGLTSATTYRRITTSTLGSVACTATSNDIVVSVSAVTGGTIASSQTICNGGDPAAFTESAASTGSGTLSYAWKYSTDSYASTLSTSSTYDVASGLTATTTYRRITTSTSGGVTCTANSNDIVITVQSAVTGGTIAAAQTICSGGDPAAFTQSVAATGSGTLSYEWKSSADTYVSTLGTSSTYDAPSGLTSTTTYRRITTSTSGSVTCTANSNDIVVTVQSSVTGGSIAAAQTICNGGDPAAFTETAASSGSGTLSYEWKYSTDGYASVLGTGTTYDVSSGLSSTTTYRRVTSSTVGSVACTANSNDIVVNVQSAVTGGTIATAQTICNGGDPAAFTESVASTGSGTLSYAWKYSTDSYSSTLGTSSTYDAPSALTASTTYRRITTSTVGSLTCTATSNDIVVTVQSSVTGGTIASSQTICSGGDPAAFTESTSSTGSGALTYAWKQSTDSYAATLATTATYDVSSGLTATTTYRRITTSTLGSVACTATSNDITVTVQSSVTGGTIASSQTICNGGDPAAFTESVASTGSGTLSYSWKYSTDSYASTLSTSSTYDVASGLTATTTYRRITTSTSGGVTCTANSNDIIITVQSAVTGGTIAAAQTICSGGDPAAFTQSVAATGSGTLSYEWKSSADSYVASLGTSTTYDAPSGLTVSTTYRRITTSTSGSVTCTATSNDILVTVQSSVTGGSIAAAQTICNGGDPAAFTETVASTGSGTLTYAWKYDTDGYASVLGTGTTYDVSSGLTLSTTYRRVTTSTSGSVTCTANSNDIIVTVQSAVTGGTIAAAQTICNGGDPVVFTVTVASTGSGSLSYQWKQSVDGYVATIASTSAYDVPSGLTASTTYRRITTSTVGSLTCTATSNDIVVTVQSSVTGGTIASSQTICNGGDPAAFTESVSSTGSGTLTYAWKQSTDSYAATLATSATYDVSSGLTATTTYRRITTSTSGSVACTANSNDIVVTVQSAVTGGTIAAAQTMCNGGDPLENGGGKG